MEKGSWSVCLNCLGRGTKRRKLSKKVRLQYQKDVAAHEQAQDQGEPPVRPKGHLYFCENCDGAGIIKALEPVDCQEQQFPHIAIIGGGIAGVALAVACQHRGIPFTVYERDADFDVRSQGYGLTLQQANRAMKSLGITKINDGVISTRHVAHTAEGEIIGEWGNRRWCATAANEMPKRSNIHIARQSLRKQLIDEIKDSHAIKWGHQLLHYTQNADNGFDLHFNVEGVSTIKKADIIVGADGIRSTVRRLLLGESIKPLRYLNCVVILGICTLESIGVDDCPLLDGRTIFQTANGTARIYVMPYTADTVMWQLSFPMDEKEAHALRHAGATAIKEEALQRTAWHAPIPQLIRATSTRYISGYPVYDRELLTSELEEANQAVTLIGDAAHPMSPFKGQGANQAILDALSLARALYEKYHFAGSIDGNFRTDVLSEFEKEMLSRSNSKVKDSADAAVHLHSDLFFEGGDQPRGRSCAAM